MIRLSLSLYLTTLQPKKIENEQNIQQRLMKKKGLNWNNLMMKLFHKATRKDLILKQIIKMQSYVQVHFKQVNVKPLRRRKQISFISLRKAIITLIRRSITMRKEFLYISKPAENVKPYNPLIIVLQFKNLYQYHRSVYFIRNSITTKVCLDSSKDSQAIKWGTLEVSAYIIVTNNGVSKKLGNKTKLVWIERQAICCIQVSVAALFLLFKFL